MHQTKLLGRHILRRFRPNGQRSAAVTAQSFRAAPTQDPTQCRTKVSRDLCSEVLPFVAVPTDAVHVVKEKNNQLRSILKTLRWPKLRSVEVDGQVYHLPYAKLEAGSCSPSKAVQPRGKIDYLAGFFDGDGFVGSTRTLSGCRLVVGQSVDQAQILLQFQETFGGGISRSSDGVGLQRPMLAWSISGIRARSAACELAKCSITKRKQLLLAAQWPKDKRLQEEFNASLSCLKKQDSAVPAGCTLEYFTGFFDADGCITIRAEGGMRLEVSQRFGNVLDCLKDCLSEVCGVESCVRSYRHVSVLSISGAYSCKLLLHAMLRAGLSCKAQQAEIALSLTRENLAEVRRGKAQLGGNQYFGKKLDEHGIQRIRSIAALQQKARRWMRQGQTTRADAMLQEVAAMQADHEKLNAQMENLQLSEYVCKVHYLHREQGDHGK